MNASKSLSSASFWTRALWWALVVSALVWYWEAHGLPRVAASFGESPPAQVLAWAGALAASAILLLLGRFGDLGLARMPERLKSLEAVEQTSVAGDSRGMPFPQGATLTVAIWLVAVSVLLTIALFPLLHPEVFAPRLACGEDSPSGCSELQNILVTMVAGGIGSVITTTFGYLKHASVLKDFDAAFTPWYFARPLIGVLLGVVFYFVLKGGLMATVGPSDASQLNVYGLAGLAALVGLFSKNAIEKLKEVFETLFTTRSEMKDEIRDDTKLKSPS